MRLSNPKSCEVCGNPIGRGTYHCPGCGEAMPTGKFMTLLRFVAAAVIVFLVMDLLVSMGMY